MRSVSDGPLAVARIALRAVAIVGGGYACTAVAVTLGAALLARAGMVRSEAVVLMAMLGFPLYLGLLLWGFSLRRVSTWWLVPGAAAATFALLRITLG
ncbi:hypothetical protein [Pseudoduganella albidiflava]|uniref:Iron transporter n=1 Tax=Pseudoduganella albidiflava TaxID=321983 RepID=A0A411X087_9BURK|nr:hypothetical protein [Pseudoduganella albidiflava]QBI02265.1 hypothetical protein EYF70_16495 [Pseudoduganella albidiflava]GGY67497.1 hypothetical protein GCM10007387_57190 [Pseudoduganella albidiflava]